MYVSVNNNSSSTRCFGAVHYVASLLSLAGFGQAPKRRGIGEDLGGLPRQQVQCGLGDQGCGPPTIGHTRALSHCCAEVMSICLPKVAGSVSMPSMAAATSARVVLGVPGIRWPPAASTMVGCGMRGPPDRGPGWMVVQSRPLPSRQDLP